MNIAVSSPTARVAASPVAAGVAVAAAVLLVGTASHAQSYANTDIAWLLTVCERLLDGAVLYRDIIETNPPGSVLLYLPAVLLGRATGFDPQLVAMLLTGLACTATLVWCAILLGGALPTVLRGPLLAVAAATLVLLPMESFGQREHIILMSTMPLLCRLALRGTAVRRPCGTAAGIAAGVAAGIGLAIKPYYALGLVGPALRVLRCAGWRELAAAPDLWATATTATALLVAQLVLFPAFTHEVLPLLGRVYLPMRLPLSMLLGLTGGAAALAVLLGSGLARCARPGTASDGVSDTAGLTALGFFLAYLAQGKGWAYHAYPCTAVALVGLGARLIPAVVDDGSSMTVCATRGAARLRVGLILAAAGAPRGRLILSRIAALALAGWAAIGFDSHMDIDATAPGLAAAVSDLGPHPRVLSLASDIAVGHPLVRRVGGVWVGTLMSSWIDIYVERVAPGRGRSGPLGPDLALEDRTFAADIRDRHPDAVLADTPGWDRWIAAAPDTAAALQAYRPGRTYGNVVLWTRKPGG